MSLVLDFVWQFEVKDEKGKILAKGEGLEDFREALLRIPTPGTDGVGWQWQVRWWKTF